MYEEIPKRKDSTHLRLWINLNKNKKDALMCVNIMSKKKQPLVEKKCTYP